MENKLFIHSFTTLKESNVEQHALHTTTNTGKPVVYRYAKWPWMGKPLQSQVEGQSNTYVQDKTWTSGHSQSSILWVHLLGDQGG